MEILTVLAESLPLVSELKLSNEECQEHEG